MSDPVRSSIHIRRLLKIKERPNQYPVYKYNLENQKSPKTIKMDKIKLEIKANRRNITTVKKCFGKKRPVNYSDDKYIYDRQVENFQKELLNSLIKKNRELKNELNTLKYGRNEHIFLTPLKSQY